ncbi:DNA cytosine methyltransferase [Pseudomonas citronellolis]|uniref:DNA cytosine methyltransferase n=1 Tax=Pseudomonas citronellolis TaxID=53408 RepID=UPI00264940F4|nr:DNA cytosine methyltransferase [Pseudomonas citronellolis]MDN6872910.1 DNA cytosine methyltransferase [Pseudomonas citronellolis]
MTTSSMQLKAADMFAGMGGWSTAASQENVRVLWAANHWPEAVHYHAQNHPNTHHVCQDLRQADFHLIPDIDLLLASPCCQGHSRARGKANGNPAHDASRATAWAVVDCLEAKRPYAGLLENVVEFLNWALYPAWEMAVRALGYQVAPHIVDCADLGVPQNRKRLFLVLTRSRAPLMLQLPTAPHVPASTFIDFDRGNWSAIERPGRAAATLRRVANGRTRFGERFLMPYYGTGSGTTGRSLGRPIGTITTRDRWAIVDGNRMRMLDADENLAAMSFPSTYKRPQEHALTVHMAGNAVPPKAGAALIRALKEAA